jgi:hypothetical protein
LELMGNPEKDLKMVHVAGTNGKGSVTYLIASLLSAAGYRVGRFSSPHLHSYTERFTIDGQEIKLPRFKAYLDHIEEQVGQLLRVGKEHQLFPGPHIFRHIFNACMIETQSFHLSSSFTPCLWSIEYRCFNGNPTTLK